MSPGSGNRKRADTTRAFFDELESPAGTFYLVFLSSSLIRIDFAKPRELPFRHSDAFSSAKQELKEYFAGKRRTFTCKTEFVEGTEFEQTVWRGLSEVAFGETKTYSWLAEKIGQPRAFRAVGRALGKNPLPIIVPCHRIIERSGSLGGFSGGTEVKRKLLDLEYYFSFSKTTPAAESAE